MGGTDVVVGADVGRSNAGLSSVSSMTEGAINVVAWVLYEHLIRLSWISSAVRR